MTQLKYQLKTETVSLQSEMLQITSLANLNRTIDDLFLELEKTGDANLLEELCPYFGCVWPSAKALCNYLQFSSVKKLLPGADFLEVGCGLALPSLLAAKLGAKITATDFHPEVPAFLAINCEQNQIRGIRYESLDWRDTKSQKTSKLGLYDFIVGSDVLYENSHSLILAHAIADHLKPSGRIVIADPARPYLQAFVDEMRRLGFQSQTTVQTVPDQPTSKEIFIVEFARGDFST